MVIGKLGQLQTVKIMKENCLDPQAFSYFTIKQGDGAALK